MNSKQEGTHGAFVLHMTPEGKPGWERNLVPAGIAVQTDVAPVRKIAHKADQGRAALPHVAALPPQNARHGIEVPIKGMAGAITIDYNFSATS